VRARALRAAPGPPGPDAAPFDAGALLDALGPARLLELVVVDMAASSTCCCSAGPATTWGTGR
jgi:hypothetical protein